MIFISFQILIYRIFPSGLQLISLKKSNLFIKEALYPRLFLFIHTINTI